jgi:hypothetical protein
MVRLALLVLLAGLVAIVLVAAVTGARFDRRVDAEVSALFQAARPAAVTPVRPEELVALPPPVRRWLEAARVVGQPRAHTVCVRQRGTMRSGPDGAWMPAEAVQAFTVNPPGFVWKVSARMKGLPLSGRDRYGEGRGHMLIRLAALVTVADADDEKIAQGALLRWLAETVWFPSAALSPAIVWTPVDDHSARATIRHHGLTVSALFTFDGGGRFLRLRAERYLGGGREGVLRTWVVSARAWRVVRGIEIPTAGEVVWQLPEGDFTFYRWEIVDVETNCRKRLPAPAARGRPPSGARSRGQEQRIAELAGQASCRTGGVGGRGGEVDRGDDLHDGWYSSARARPCSGIARLQSVRGVHFLREPGEATQPLREPARSAFAIGVWRHQNDPH